MLEITIHSGERFDEETRTFISLKKDVKITLEHSLISISRWESIYKRPYLSDRGPRTGEEILDYIRCMTITQNVDPNAYYFLSESDLQKINEYLGNEQTATTFHSHVQDRRRKKGETPSSELIYYWMFSMGIPKDCERWHISRLLTLIRVFDVKQSKPKKRSKKQMIAERNALNKARRAQYNTTG